MALHCPVTAVVVAAAVVKSPFFVSPFRFAALASFAYAVVVPFHLVVLAVVAFVWELLVVVDQVFCCSSCLAEFEA